jgi:hypothetical protein
MDQRLWRPDIAPDMSPPTVIVRRSRLPGRRGAGSAWYPSHCTGEDQPVIDVKPEQFIGRTALDNRMVRTGLAAVSAAHFMLAAKPFDGQRLLAIPVDEADQPLGEGYAFRLQMRGWYNPAGSGMMPPMTIHLTPQIETRLVDEKQQLRFVDPRF